MLLPYLTQGCLEAGCDEAGRGCLCGDVFAAAVILPEDFFDKRLNDSKKLSEKQRYVLRDVILEKALSWGVGRVDAGEIDQINILNASFLAMNRAIEQLSVVPQMLLIDGNRFRSSLGIDYRCIVKGDGKMASIAAASILAKTFRDDYMAELHLQYPHYQWNKNKGYPTAMHRKAIEQHGITPYHRKSFCGCSDPLLF